MEKKKNVQIEDDNILNQIMFRFVPYWPLFVCLLIIAGIGGFIYLRYATPIYEVSATMLIKDEKKGFDDSRIMQSLNIFSSNNIVENEMEVLHSRELMNEVVIKLNLYAPVFSEGRIRSISAYTSSPVIIQAKNPQKLDTALAERKIYFTYDSANKQVKIENKKYPLNKWVSTSYGKLKFAANPSLKTLETKPLFFYLIPVKKVTGSILENMAVSAPNKLATIVKLTLRDESARRGENILNELISVYNLAAITDKNEFSAKTLSIVTERLAYVGHQVDSIQKTINEYKEKKGIVNLSEQSSMFLKSVGENDQKVADVNMQAAVLNEVEQYVNSKDHNAGIIPSTLGIDNPVLSSLLQKLYELESNYDKQKMTATENNPMLVSLGNEIEKTRANILENTRVQRISINASRSNLNSTINDYSSKLKDIPEKERELVEISRQLAVLSNTYDFLLQKKEEASLSNESAVSNSRTVDNAQSSLLPASPQKSIVFLIAIAAAMAIGCAIVLYRELFSSKILFRSEIDKYTNIPVAAEILNLKTTNKRKVTDKQKETIINEQFRQLAASIGLYARNTSKKKLLITSSITGEGKSFVSSNLAKCLASSGKKVILLDLDFRNPQASRTFNLDEEIGISNYLDGEKEPGEIIKQSEHKNLFIASAGSVEVEKTNELLLNDRLPEFFNYLEKSFDFIIVDTPPVEPVSDAYILSEYCDSSLFVVRHRYTPKALIRLLDENNKIKALKNTAIIFNGVRPRGFIKRTYGYGYGFNYEYGYNQKRKRKRA